jgi:uncharacterized protein (DUF1778 family)
MAAKQKSPARTRRINLPATDPQVKLIRTGAEMSGVSFTDFILESACLQAEWLLADKRDFAVSPAQWKAFIATLDRPARIKSQVARFFFDVGIPKREPL